MTEKETVILDNDKNRRPVVINAEPGSSVSVYCIEIQTNNYTYPQWMDDELRKIWDKKLGKF